MTTIYIDNHPYDANPEHNLLQVCLSLGFNLPYFCWHPALGSVGACRQCAVKQFRDAQDTRGRLVMACMTPAAENTRIAVEDAEAKAFRASVIEWLMINHPHDCPVCDEGGRCHLQDMTVMTGHTMRRYRFAKRTYRNQDLGPFINHEMNRCIQCYRCVRFYRDYAGGRDLDAFASRNQVYFGRHEDGVLENEFSGNLVEVCPTGVFTDKTLKQHYTRKWDLQTAPSICVHCSLGCNTIPGERYGILREITNRYNYQVNGYFLCDRGRFGYDFVNSPRRLRQPLLRHGHTATPVSKETALEHVAALLQAGSSVLGIGSPRAGLEANFALRTLVSPEHFYLGVSAREQRLLSAVLSVLRHGPARTPSLHDVEQADAVFVLGEDVTNTAPRLALALRQAVRQQPLRQVDKLHIPRWNDAAIREFMQQQTGPLFLATPTRTRLDAVASETFHAAPDDVARLGFAVAHALSGNASPVADVSDEMRTLASRIAQALQEAERPLVVSGTSLGSEAVVHAAANVAWALCENDRSAHLCLTVPECNSLGAALLDSGSLEAAFQAVQNGTAETVIILENDLYRRADAATVQAFLEACQHVIVIDHRMHATAEQAEVILPAGTFAETDGTLVSNEGRAQRFLQVFVPPGDVQESWRWLRDVMLSAGRDERSVWQNLDDVVEALAHTLPVFAALPNTAPHADFRLAGQRVPRQPHRYSGRTAITAQRSVHEPKPPDDPDTPLAFSMEGYEQQPPPPLIPFFWAPGWNSPQAVNKFQSEVGSPLRGGDPGIRLFEPVVDGGVTFFRQIPEAFSARDGTWLLVPLYHIFGSEELSVLAPAVAARVPPPYLVLSAADAAALQVGPADAVVCAVAGTTHRLPVHVDPTLPTGIAGLPVGLPALQGISLPVWGTLTKAGQS
jgi:NADH-quinone oxidoreductase subunit G